MRIQTAFLEFIAVAFTCLDNSIYSDEQEVGQSALGQTGEP